jgi:hypothetical protein
LKPVTASVQKQPSASSDGCFFMRDDLGAKKSPLSFDSGLFQFSFVG